MLSGYSFYYKEILNEQLNKWDVELTQARIAEEVSANTFQTRLDFLQQDMKHQQEINSHPAKTGIVMTKERVAEQIAALDKLNAESRDRFDHLSDETAALVSAPNELANQRNALNAEYEKLMATQRDIVAPILKNETKAPLKGQYVLVTGMMLLTLAFDITTVLFESEVAEGAKRIHKLIDEKMTHYEHVRWGCFYAGLFLAAIGAVVSHFNKPLPSA